MGCCVLTPGSGCFIQIAILKSTPHREKQITQLEVPFFIMYKCFLDINVFYIKRVRDVDFMKGEKDKLRCF